MPTYKFKCECGNSRLRHCRASKRRKAPYCGKCGEIMERDIVSERKGGHILEPYLDHNLGPDPVWVKGRKQRRRLKKEAGVREKGSYIE